MTIEHSGVAYLRGENTRNQTDIGQAEFYGKRRISAVLKICRDRRKCNLVAFR
jgi:hypothetical protein